MVRWTCTLCFLIRSFLPSTLHHVRSLIKWWNYEHEKTKKLDKAHCHVVWELEKGGVTDEHFARKIGQPLGCSPEI